jgi:hypothetical protein
MEKLLGKKLGCLHCWEVGEELTDIAESLAIVAVVYGPKTWPW